MVKSKQRQPRDVRFMTRLTQEQARDIRQKADAANLTISAYLAMTATDRKLQVAEVAPEINRQLYLELSRYNSNLNQIARHLNEGRILTNDASGLLDNMRRMYALIREVRTELSR